MPRILMKETIWFILAVCTVALFANLLARYRNSPAEDSAQVCRANETLIAKAIWRYRVECYGVAPARLTALVPRFISRLPTCPTHPGGDYRYQRYSDAAAGADYIISCPGSHPTLEEGFPKINSSCTDSDELPAMSSRQLVERGARVLRSPTPLNWRADFGSFSKGTTH
jgi:hypothetical protein